MAVVKVKKRYFYVDEDSPFMRQAMRVAQETGDRDWPTGVVVVSAIGRSSSGRKVRKIIGRGANGSEYHLKFGCRRKELGIPTGERYDLCEGCDPKHHAEARAITAVRLTRSVPVNGEVYLWGHWWCCENCWQMMIDAGIKKVYLVKGAYVRFNQVRNSSTN